MVSKGEMWVKYMHQHFLKRNWPFPSYVVPLRVLVQKTFKGKLV